jgi:AraC-like DNA-binding protein
MTLLNISANLTLLISASGILQAVLLAMLLYFHPKSDKSVNVFLSLYIFCISILMLIPSVQQLFSWQIILYLMPFPLLIGPFLYLYVRSFKEAITWRKAWPHFLLFFIFLLLDYLFLPYLVNKYPTSHPVTKEMLLNPSSYIRITTRIVRNVQMIVYYFLAQRTLTSYQKSIHHLFSEVSQINLDWVRWLINGYLFLIISLLVLFYFVVRYPDQFELLIVINMTIITPYIYLITFKGITQRTLWQIQPDLNKEAVEKEMNEAEKIESFREEENQPVIKGLPETKATEVISRLILLMEKDKLYQEHELTLQTLSDNLRMPAYQVSQAINDGLKKNFYDLVNGYRVEEAKRLLVDPKNENFTILSVGFEAGFNSKTTFNTVFKKFTGVTPTEYRDQQKLVAASV